MKEFSYRITDPNGIHARPAGMLVKECAKYNSKITINFNGKEADAKKIFSVMGLGVRSGDSIRIAISGDDEETAEKAVLEFIRNNF